MFLTLALVKWITFHSLSILVTYLHKFKNYLKLCMCPFSDVFHDLLHERPSLFSVSSRPSILPSVIVIIQALLLIKCLIPLFSLSPSVFRTGNFVSVYVYTLKNLFVSYYFYPWHFQCSSPASDFERFTILTFFVLNTSTFQIGIVWSHSIQNLKRCFRLILLCMWK